MLRVHVRPSCLTAASLAAARDVMAQSPGEDEVVFVVWHERVLLPGRVESSASLRRSLAEVLGWACVLEDFSDDPLT